MREHLELNHFPQLDNLSQAGGHRNDTEYPYFCVGVKVCGA